jgi:cytochrome P450
MDLQPYLPYLTKWYSIAAILFILYYGITYINRSIYIRKHGCKEAPVFCYAGLFSIPLTSRLVKSRNQGYLADYIYEMYRAMGCESFLIYLFGVRVVCTFDPENIKAVLATQFNDFALGIRHAHFLPLLGDGIFTLDGEGWKQSRTMLRPQFAREQVAHVRSLEPHVQVLFKLIDSAGDKTINIQDLFFKYTMDTATEFLFGQSVNSLSDDIPGYVSPVDFEGRKEFSNAFNTSQAYLGSRAYSQIFHFLINNKEFKNCNKIVHKFTQYFVQKALNASPEELEKLSSEGYTFLYELAKQTRNPQVIQDQILNILLAGRDTTAGILSFAFYELSRNPRVLEKLKQEIHDTFGQGEDAQVEEITFESLKKCEYLKFFINEMLRLYPSVPVNFRTAVKETTLPRGGGPDGQSPLYVAKGTTVAYSVYVTHRLEEYYGKDALEFYPERWANLSKLGWAYVPFNGGPRICLGQQFALTEISYTITRILQNYSKVELRDTAPYPPKKAVHLTMCHQDGVFVSLKK